MIKTSHTPGPWTVEACPVNGGVHPLHDNRHIVSNGGIVCDLRDQPAQSADARLIAAAPELLHALKWAAEFVSLYTANGAGWTGVQQAHDRGRFINPDNGDLDPEAMRKFLAQVIGKATLPGGAA